MNKRRFNRRERRKAKQSGFRRAPKKPGVVGHGSNRGQSVILTLDKLRAKVRAARRRLGMGCK